ncbi:uncharacterized protein LOC117331466 [Pecten maximus]|uniref:uncharacterized protein LOC117331466 n=1 Tax=Pecten maximus TaxID=6579 RepID=UPI0014584307|nr:uncharacterized protein LOC117331466 [Pecten maximus]
MVLRKGKHGVTSGSSICSYCNSRDRRCWDGFVLKFLLNDRDGNEDAAMLLNQHLSDGDLTLMKSDMYFSWGIVKYSLNKRKRWTLPQQIIDVIDNGDLDKENYRLVMHKRVNQSNVLGYSRYHYDTMSYHDSKYGVHHSHPKKSLSSMSDLKLNCHRKQQKSELAKITSMQKLRKCRKKPHFRGIQRKAVPQPKEKPPRINIREVLNGDFHQAPVPEVRYEIGSPIMTCNYCSHHYYNEWDKMTHIKGKGWCAKPNAQWYYKNITSSDQKLYQKGYIDDEELSCFEKEDLDCLDEEASQYLYADPVQITLADFCRTPSKRQEQTVTPCSHGNTTPNTASKHTSRAYFGKNKVIYVELPSNGSEEEEMKEEEVEEVEDSGKLVVMTTAAWDKADFDSDCYHCVIQKGSIERYRLTHPGDFHLGNCAPPMMMVTLTAVASQGNLVLWQQSEWSPVSSQDPEYWVKVQSQSERVNMKLLSMSLQNGLQRDRVYTIQEMIIFVETLLNQSTQHQSCVQDRKNDNMHTGQLAATLCGSVVELRTVDEAYKTLVSTEDTKTDTVTPDMIDLLSNYDVVSNDLSPLMESGLCETCLCQSEVPYTEGCVLMPCGHYFCVECWRQYIWERIRAGAHKIICQRYLCDCEVDEVMVRCLLPSDVATRWIYRKMETLVESSQKWNWCPGASCHKVAKLASPGKSFSPVLCSCGKTWCFSCVSDIHWPATCDQYSAYKKMLLQNGDDGRWTPVETMTYYVKVKRCPKCMYPMEKNGGCSQIRCKCSHSFCWECLGDWNLHISTRMLSCTKNKKDKVTMALENHIKYAFPIKMYKKSVEHRHRWKRIFHVESVEARAKSYALKAMKGKLMKNREIMDKEIYAQVKSSLMFHREVHMVLENILVMLSNATHKSGIRSQVSLILDRLIFSAGRLDQIFDSTHLTENHLMRISRLQTSIRCNLTTMALYVPWIQQQISKSKQAVLNKPINTFTSFY